MLFFVCCIVGVSFFIGVVLVGCLIFVLFDFGNMLIFVEVIYKESIVVDVYVDIVF